MPQWIPPLHGPASSAIYPPLPQAAGPGKDEDRYIRLLKLHAVSKTDGPKTTVECSLSQTRLRDTPSYEAVSYRWGNEDKSTNRMIRLDGVEWEVRDNLWRLLCEFRCFNEDRILWVDAICINQDDIIEKSFQVQLMGRIFAKAEAVLAWLGDGSDGSEAALSWFDRFSLSDSTTMREENGAKKAIQESSLPVNLYSARIHFYRLARNPYWMRAWIVQEYLLGAKVQIHCGHAKVQACRLLDALRVLHDRLPPAPKPYELIPDYDLEEIRRAFGRRKMARLQHDRAAFSSWSSHLRNLNPNLEAQGPPVGGNMTSLLSKYQYSICSDPRDKVFAFLSLLPPHIWRHRIVVDYAVDIRALYCSVMHACATELGNQVRMGEDLRVALGMPAFSGKKYLSETAWHIEQRGRTASETTVPLNILRMETVVKVASFSWSRFSKEYTLISASTHPETAIRFLVAATGHNKHGSVAVGDVLLRLCLRTPQPGDTGVIMRCIEGKPQVIALAKLFRPDIFGHFTEATRALEALLDPDILNDEPFVPYKNLSLTSVKVPLTAWAAICACAQVFHPIAVELPPYPTGERFDSTSPSTAPEQEVRKSIEHVFSLVASDTIWKFSED